MDGPLDLLVKQLSSLPGLGRQSAKRIALHLLTNKEELMHPLSYHVLGGVLSALDGVSPKDLTLNSLLSNIDENNVNEVILALSVTVDGQSTAHYITDLLQDKDIKITRLAHGVPMGGELNYLDDGTISNAIKSRANLR